MKVYVGMAADYLHIGHINLINTAKEYGDVVIGLLTDEAISSYKRIPITSYEQREEVVKNIDGVTEVVPQETLDYVSNLKKLKPNYKEHFINSLDLYESIKSEKETIKTSIEEPKKAKLISNFEKNFNNKNKMSLQEIYEEFWEFIDEENEIFRKFIISDKKRRTLLRLRDLSSHFSRS